MKNSIVGLIATTLFVLLSGLSGLFIPLVGGISALMHEIPNLTLTVISRIVDPYFSWANGCCICIPIPLVFGIFALIQRRNASTLAESRSQPGADI